MRLSERSKDLITIDDDDDSDSDFSWWWAEGCRGRYFLASLGENKTKGWSSLFSVSIEISPLWFLFAGLGKWVVSNNNYLSNDLGFSCLMLFPGMRWRVIHASRTCLPARCALSPSTSAVIIIIHGLLLTRVYGSPGLDQTNHVARLYNNAMRWIDGIVTTDHKLKHTTKQEYSSHKQYHIRQ